MQKPIVYYQVLLLPVRKGEETIVIIPEGKTRFTSPVLDSITRINDNRPVFETMNTIYIPAD